MENQYKYGRNKEIIMFKNGNRYFKYKNIYINKYKIISFEIILNETTKGGVIHLKTSVDDQYSFDYLTTQELYKAASNLSGEYFSTTDLDKKAALNQIPF